VSGRAAISGAGVGVYGKKDYICGRLTISMKNGKKNIAVR
jgi:hypothetical protein